MLFRKAILIVHGFAGGTYDEEALANYLELNRCFDVYQFTLPGHDKNLSKATSEDWIRKSEKMLEWLIKKGYRNIYVIGHSMGGVIAAYLAAKYKEVKKLVLAAPAFHYLSVDSKDSNPISSIKKIPNVIKSYGGSEVVSRMLKLNINTLNEFTHLVKENYDVTKDITCPTLILQGTKDNLVPLSSSKYVYETIKSKKKRIVYLEGMNHDLFRGKNKEDLYKQVERFLKIGL